MFNEQTICMECKEKERHLPRYKEALEADRAAVKAGNWNFPGIGLYTNSSGPWLHRGHGFFIESEELCTSAGPWLFIESEELWPLLPDGAIAFLGKIVSLDIQHVAEVLR